jgi:hypothetical protein
MIWSLLIKGYVATNKGLAAKIRGEWPGVLLRAISAARKNSFAGKDGLFGATLDFMPVIIVFKRNSRRWTEA